MSVPIIPRSYIYKTSTDAICQICFQIGEEMMICGESCRKYYCSKCIIQRNLSECPNELQTDIKLDVVNDWKVSFYCPFNKQLCKQTRSVQQFWEHCYLCQYTPKQIKEELQNRSDYRCRKGHRLIFVTLNNFNQIYLTGNHYSTPYEEVCTHCKEVFLSKSVCVKCGIIQHNQAYCVLCRPIPYEKGRCPIGHALEKDTNIQDNLICDICGLQANKYGKCAYSSQSYL